MATIQEKMASIALKEVGNGPSKYRTWFYGYSAAGVPWCAVFVSWTANQAGTLNKHVEKTDGAGSIARESIAKGWGKWYESGSIPKIGDFVTFCWNGLGYYPGQDKYFSDHVGIVVGVDQKNKVFYTVEGNVGGTNDTSTVQKRSYAFSNSMINGFYRPNYPVEAPAAPAPPKPAAPTVTTGKAAIKQVQTWVNKNYGTTIAGDGIYGKNTKAAYTGALQCYLNSKYKAKLAVDGIFGTKTKAAVREAARGAKGDYVYLLQGMLICRGYSTNGFDGDFGGGTQSAVKAFQKASKIAVDGIAGKNTFEKLYK